MKKNYEIIISVPTLYSGKSVARLILISNKSRKVVEMIIGNQYPNYNWSCKGFLPRFNEDALEDTDPVRIAVKKWREKYSLHNDKTYNEL